MGASTTVFKEEVSKHLFNMTAVVFIRIVLLGALVGLVTWLLAFALNKYLLTPFFCDGGDNVSICANGTVVSSNIAAVLVGVMTVPLLTTIYARRALLVVILTIVTLWGVAAWVAGLWYVSLFWTVAVYAAVYAVFSWINRLRSIIVALILAVLFVVAARVVLSFS